MGQTIYAHCTPIYRTPRHLIHEFGIHNHCNGLETTPLQRLHLIIGLMLGAMTLVFALIRILDDNTVSVGWFCAKQMR